VVKLCKLIHIVPDFLLRSMENMCAILVDLDAFYFLCVNITADMITLVDHQAGLALLSSFVSKYSSKKSGSYN